MDIVTAVRERLGLVEAPATSMVVLRVWLYGAVAVWALAFDAEQAAHLAELHWDPRSGMKLLPGPPSAAVLLVAQVGLVVVATSAAAGALTPWTMLATAGLALPLMGTVDASLGKIYHHTSLTAMLLVALAPAPLGAFGSLDRWRARRRGIADPPRRSVRWAWPPVLAMATVVFVYLGSGVAKAVNGGLAWLRPESFQRWSFVKLDRMEDPTAIGLFVAEHPVVAGVTAAGLLAFQLSVAGALVWPRFRPVVIVGIVVFHTMSWFTLGLDFWLMSAVAWVPLVDWDAVRARVLPDSNAPGDVPSPAPDPANSGR